MQKPSMFFLAETLDFNKCPLALETIKQASIFAERGFETTLLSFDFNAFYPYLRSKLYQETMLNKHVIVRNMHEDLAGYSRPSLLKKDMPVFDVAIFEEQGYVERKSDSVYEVRQDGKVVKRIILAETGTLSEIQYMDNAFRYYREVYNPWGKLKRKTYTSSDLNERRQEIYFNKKGKAYLSVWYDKQTGAFDKAHRLTDKGAIIKEFSQSAAELKADWLQYVLEKVERPVVVSNSRASDEILRSVNSDHAAKIVRMNMISKNRSGESQEQPYNELAEADFSDFDGFFLQSEFEKERLSEIYGNHDKMYVIPYCPETKGRKFNLFKRKRKDKRLAVALSVTNGHTDFEQILKAFKMTQDKHEFARLHLYGKRSDAPHFERIQRELKLESSTEFYVIGPKDASICEPALFSIIVSEYGELNFPALESMSSNTPVISFQKQSYKEQDLVQDGQTGFIVEDEDIQELANRMSYMFNHPAKAFSMGEKAKRHVQKHYSKETYARKWQTYVEDIVSGK